MYIYATKADLKNATGVDTSSFAKKTDLAKLTSDVEKLDIDKLKNEPVRKANYDEKILEIENKYFTTSYYNTFTSNTQRS